MMMNYLLKNKNVLLILAVFYISLLLANKNTAGAQEQKPEAEFIQKKINDFIKSHTSSSLFLHVDKHIYTENEPIWFSAYLLNTPVKNFADHTSLTVFLFTDNTKEVVTSGRFIFKDGLGSGNLTVPDSVAAGKYHLFAYTNLLDQKDNPLATFSMPIEVKSAKIPAFSSHVTLSGENKKDKSLKAEIKVDFDDKNKKDRPEVNCIIAGDTLKSFLLKEKRKTIEIPKEFLEPEENVLITTVKYKGQKQVVNTALRERKKEEKELISLRFFPEGGSIVSDVPCNIAFEAKDKSGQPLQVEGELYENKERLKGIRTKKNGIGKFKVMPNIKNKYTLKIKSGKYIDQDTIIELPEITNHSASLHIEKALADDTLTVDLSLKRNVKVQLLINDYRGNYALFETTGDRNAKTLHIPLEKLPKGVASITLLDNYSRPMAERTFFAHYNDTVHTEIKTDKSKYKKREKAKVNILLKDTDGAPLKGIFSVAVVQTNRIVHPFADIEKYIFSQKALHKNTDFDLNGESMEDLLLVKGWTRYTWTDVLNNNRSNNIESKPMSFVSGQVKRFNKSLKNPVSVIILSGGKTNMIETNKKGSFQVLDRFLFTDTSDKALLMVSSDNNRGFSIKTEDPYKSLNQSIATNFKTGRPTKESLSTNHRMEGLEHTIQLDEVEVGTKRNSAGLYGYYGKPGANAGGDYVDEFDYLNYEFSKNRYQPIEGKLYRKRTDLSEDRSVFEVEPVVYHGCTTEEYKSAVKIEGIYGNREFYGMDDSQEQTQNLSTIFWKPLLLTDKNGQASFEFITGDITGEFDIITQGIVKDNVFSKTQKIVVK